MLREFQVTKDKPANSMHKAAAAVMTGMAVLKNDENKTFALPEADAVADLFWVDKERIPKGVNAARVNMSDYHEDFVKVEIDEFAKLIAYYPGERFGTDQFEEAEYTVGDRLCVGTDGKIKKATMASRYVFKGYHDDAGHKLVIVEVSDTPAANA